MVVPSRNFHEEVLNDESDFKNRARIEEVLNVDVREFMINIAAERGA
jgi:hypothetical protein